MGSGSGREVERVFDIREMDSAKICRVREYSKASKTEQNPAGK